MLRPRSAAGRTSLFAAPRPRRHLLSLLARLGQPDRNRLLATPHLASPAAWTAPGRAALVAAHLVPDVRSRAWRISPRRLMSCGDNAASTSFATWEFRPGRFRSSRDICGSWLPVMLI